MKKILSVIMAVVMLGSLAAVLTACKGDVEPVAATTALAASSTVTEKPTDATAATTLAPSEKTTEAAVEPTTAAPVSDPTVAQTEVTTEATTEVTTAATTKATTKATAKATTKATTKSTTKAAQKAPATKEEIVKLYNDAFNGVNTAKAGYTKTRTTSINSLDGGALLKISVVKDAVGDFFGQGTNSFTNKKGKTDYLGKASLTAADVSSATCTEKNGKYTVVLTLNGGTGSASASGISDTSPVKKSGLFVGTGNNTDYDYKSAENVYTSINGTDGASIQSCKMSTSGTKITCVIDAATGRLESFKMSFDFSADLNQVKYSIASIKKGTGTGSTTVTIDSFNY